ncbi:hypothetical protein GWK73_02550 [Candidatus Saccharibacteria bacterium oral taxon 955]|nr:hypothetical protein GWK73_02550 [Candidatus Saccharibacteria bacterium oral taxon 955]QHU91367.1 hypothetical protein GWK75_02785 [Candidatus Saccharibacteria bacterium oral taxon 955]
MSTRKEHHDLVPVLGDTDYRRWCSYSILKYALRMEGSSVLDRHAYGHSCLTNARRVLHHLIRVRKGDRTSVSRSKSVHWGRPVSGDGEQ